MTRQASTISSVRVTAVLSVVLIGGRAPAAEGIRYALLIGVNKYRHMTPLPACQNDVYALARVLVKHAGFKRDHVRVLTDEEDENRDPGLTNIRNSIDFLSRNAKPEDTVLVFFSGHGANIDGKAYLIPRDGDLRNPRNSLAVKEDVEDPLKKCEAKTKLLILDCCHAGAAGRTKAFLNPAASLQGRTPDVQMLLSCRPGELSLTDERTDANGKQEERSLFTRALIEGLEGEADADGDGSITVSELWGFVRVQTLAWCWRHGKEQTPVACPDPRKQRSDAWNRVLAKRPTPARISESLEEFLGIAPSDSVMVLWVNVKWAREQEPDIEKLLTLASDAVHKNEGSEFPKHIRLEQHLHCVGLAYARSGTRLSYVGIDHAPDIFEAAKKPGKPIKQIGSHVALVTSREVTTLSERGALVWIKAVGDLEQTVERMLASNSSVKSKVLGSLLPDADISGAWAVGWPCELRREVRDLFPTEKRPLLDAASASITLRPVFGLNCDVRLASRQAASKARESASSLLKALSSRLRPEARPSLCAAIDRATVAQEGKELRLAIQSGPGLSRELADWAKSQIPVPE